MAVGAAAARGPPASLRLPSVSWGWEVVWMLLILKIPIVYLCLVVRWAIRAKPDPLQPVAAATANDDLGPGPHDLRRWRSLPRRPRVGPHGRPVRLGRAARVARATAERR